jgi:glycosyltransferase involved in cell wall biosynthesis
VLKSTFESLEVIIVNDGSTDALTLEVLKELEQEHHYENRIQFIHQGNMGLASARNNGIKAATGKYILPLDADNMIRPHYIERAVNILEANQDVGVVYAYAKLFGEKNGIWEFPVFNAKRLLLDNFVEACSVFRKKVWEECNGYDPNMGIMGLEDWDLWIGVMERGWKFYLLKEVLFDYRVSSTSMINNCNIPENRRYLIEYICSKHKDTYIKHMAYVISEKDANRLNLEKKIKAIRESTVWRILEKLRTLIESNKFFSIIFHYFAKFIQQRI